MHGETTATLLAADGRPSTARVVATDEKADVAWLRIDGATNLPVAHLAGPGTVRLGEDVVAIGNALNLEGAPSITRGVVSAVGRSTAALQGVIQTDAAISSGSSGGALVDGTGAVIGIINGVVVSKLELTPIVTTIAMNGLLFGVVLLSFKNSELTVIPQFLTDITASKLDLLGVKIAAVLPLGLALLVVLQLILSYSGFGRSLFALGRRDGAGSSEPSSRAARAPSWPASVTISSAISSIRS